MTGEPSFFEIGVDDPERGRAFYGPLFGWDLRPGPSGHGYAIGTPGLPGGMHGGDAGASPYLFFRVDDLDAAVARVLALGGTIEELGDESGEVGEGAEGGEEGGGDSGSAARFGCFKLCRDDQGSAFGLHEPPAPR
ncbi:VOC family protein [Streptomyces sp. NPDC004610]|uniref:VOC family protein n=1 Tax=unclassified Streptomyces TaxID=2593676 RepID=UPI0033BED194